MSVVPKMSKLERILCVVKTGRFGDSDTIILPNGDYLYPSLFAGAADRFFATLNGRRVKTVSYEVFQQYVEEIARRD